MGSSSATAAFRTRYQQNEHGQKPCQLKNKSGYAVAATGASPLADWRLETKTAAPDAGVLSDWGAPDGLDAQAERATGQHYGGGGASGR